MPPQDKPAGTSSRAKKSHVAGIAEKNQAADDRGKAHGDDEHDNYDFDFAFTQPRFHARKQHSAQILHWHCIFSF
jgi:hypothetical protein